jgi:UDP-glucose 4-epimerase
MKEHERMKVFVTGGAGFIGSHTVERLLALGLDVTIYDDLSTGTLANVERLGGKAALVVGDILDAEALKVAMAGHDAAINLAAVVSVPLSLSEPDRAHAINATGALNVLEAARAHGIGRVVLASSAAVYGASQDLPLREEVSPAPLSPYAAQKWLNEAYARIYADVHGMRPVALRYFNVYGPRQDPASPYSGVLSRFIEAANGTGTATVNGDGEQTRDFVYVGDVARANCLALLAPEEVAGAVVNVGSGRATSIMEAWKTIARLAGRGGLLPNQGPERAGDVRHSLADVTRARELLRFEAETSLKDGLAATLAWLQAEAKGETPVLIRGRRREAA